MSNQVHFFVAGIPQPKGSAKAFIPKGWNRPIVTHDNPKTRPWEKTISLVAQQNMPADAPWPGPIYLQLSFTLPKPKSAPKRKEIYPIKRPDLDKLARAVKDALKSVMYLDDAQVTQLSAEKIYGERPGVEVFIVRLEEEVAHESKTDALAPCAPVCSDHDHDQ
jgi:crossover junction endodeoxyribonuclease RusA